jgi:hypothetical protein
MKDLAFVKLGIHRFTLWYCNLNSRTWIGKETYIHDLFDAHGAFCYSRSSFSCPYFVMYLSLGLMNVNLRLFASENICRRSVGDSYLSKFLLFCKGMGCPFGTNPSHV